MPKPRWRAPRTRDEFDAESKAAWYREGVRLAEMRKLAAEEYEQRELAKRKAEWDKRNGSFFGRIANAFILVFGNSPYA